MKVVYPAFQIWMGWPSCTGWDGCCLPRCLNWQLVICMAFHSDCSYQLSIFIRMMGTLINFKRHGTCLNLNHQPHRDGRCVQTCSCVWLDPGVTCSDLIGMALIDHRFIRLHRNTWSTFRPIDGSLTVRNFNTALSSALYLTAKVVDLFSNLEINQHLYIF